MILFVLIIFILGIRAGSVKFPSTVKISENDLVNDFNSWYLGLQEKESLDIKLAVKDEQIRLTAQKFLPQKKELLKVPWNLMLTAERILDITVLGQVLEGEDQHGLSQRDIISWFLAYLAECSPNPNPYQPWIEILPKQFNNLPYMTSQELILLNGSTLYHDFESQLQKIRQSHEIVEALISKYSSQFIGLCAIPWSRWQWATAVVLSRQMEFVAEDGNRFLTVIPFVDFAEHAESSTPCYGFHQKNRFFHLEACHDFSKGSIVTLPYASHLDNSELVRRFGRFEDDNLFDSVKFPYTYLGVPPDDPLLDLKTELLDRFRMTETFAIYKGSISDSLIRAAKIINALPEDFEDGKLKHSYSDLAYASMFEWFQLVARFHIDSYPTSLPEDEKFIKSEDFAAFNQRQKMLFRLVHQEKRMVHSMGVHFAQQYLELSKTLEKSDKPDEL